MKLEYLWLSAALLGCQEESSARRPPVLPAFDRGVGEDQGPVADGAQDGGPRDAEVPDFAPFDPPSTLTVATYNVENLFDLSDDPDSREDEFTPSPNGWNATKLAERLTHMARAFTALDADVVIVNEVENEDILRQLRDAISNGGGPRYPYVVTAPSRDPRGIDVGFLSRYPVLQHLGRPINNAYECEGEDGELLTLDGSRPEARPVLQVDLQLDEDPEADLTLLGMHRKAKGSRSYCEELEHRIRAATYVKGLLDTLTAEHPERGFVLLGDFNTWEFERPLAQVLQVSLDRADRPALYDVWGEFPELRGKESNSDVWNSVENSSYNFSGHWTRLDHILLTGNLLPEGDAEWRLVPGSTEPIAEDFMLRDGVPWSWDGDTGRGFSDHLPVRVRLVHAP